MQFPFTRNPYLLIPVALLVILLAACSNVQPTPGPSTPAPATPPAATTAAPPVSTVIGPAQVKTPAPSAGLQSATIALLLSSDDDRSQQVRDAFVQAATNQTTTVAVSIAGGDAAKQKAQVNDALGKGVPVLVIQPVDQDASGSYVDAAHKAGSQVIALDRLVNSRDLDAYVSYDYFKAGQLEASDAVRWLTANKTKTPWNFVLLEGPAGDSVSAEITRGYYDVLKGLVDKKQVVITADQAHPDGTADQARKTVLDALVKTNNNLMAILANSSPLARGALGALDTQKLTGKVYVAGGGADTDNVKAVCGGSQNFAVLQDISPLATGAARLAVALAHGSSVADTKLAQSTLTVADKPVPMLRVPVQPLALDTIQANLVQTGLMASDQVGKCAPPLPSGASVPTAGAQGQLTVWTHEDPAVYNYLANLAADFADANSGVKIRLVNLDADPLQNKFQSSALSSDSPDLLLTTGDQGAKFVGSDLLQPVDDWVDPTQFLSVTVGSLSVDGRLYGVPVQAANYFVLYFNKKLIKDPPADTAALLRLAPTLTRSDAQQWTLLWNQSEADYVIPWLGGFKGRILADDGRTPTLTTQAMTDTLTLLKQFRDQKVIAPDSDGEMTDTGFRLGKAAMVINGDWALKDYQAALGDNLGVARIPQVTKTREYPHPYVSARYLMAPRRLSGDRLSIARAFARFLTSRPIQVEMAIKFDRLPALKDAAADTAITSDPQLKGLADEVSVGIAEPTRDLQCFLDAIAANVGSVMSGKTTAADATKAMQDRANSCQP